MTGALRARTIWKLLPMIHRTAATQNHRPRKKSDRERSQNIKRPGPTRSVRNGVAASLRLRSNYVIYASKWQENCCKPSQGPNTNDCSTTVPVNLSKLFRVLIPLAIAGRSTFRTKLTIVWQVKGCHDNTLHSMRLIIARPRASSSSLSVFALVFLRLRGIIPEPLKLTLEY